jgi:hypothetical protein
LAAHRQKLALQPEQELLRNARGVSPVSGFSTINVMPCLEGKTSVAVPPRA